VANADPGAGRTLTLEEIIQDLGYAPEEIPLPEIVTKKKDHKTGKGKQNKRGKGNGRGDRKRAAGKKQSRPSTKTRRPGSGDDKPMGLPRPSYDKLSGGRSGKKKKKQEKGIIGFFKKLFS
jgi:hypothetical protein